MEVELFGKRFGKQGSTAEMTSSRLSPSKSGIDCKNVSVERQKKVTFRVFFCFIFDDDNMHIQMVVIVVGELVEALRLW